MILLAPWELLLLMFANFFSRATCMTVGPRSSMGFETCYCLSWRVAVEANNAQAWRTVPAQCVLYVENYMLGGQYNKDLDVVIEQISTYLNGIVAAGDGKDAWVLDIDDTCLSNLLYYQGKRFGGDPWDPSAFKSWAQRGLCPPIPAVLRLYSRLVQGGFKVFLLTGRDEEALGVSTAENLHAWGFVGYERLILRGPAYRGQSAVGFKSSMRKQLVEEGYRIRGNVGDQWSDLQGDFIGDRIFKIPNPMYFVP
ncbi:acid phosphatase 1 [Phoenix dactylifera]|uniref:Acid phosphatase 1 n=1 Tax=Phoenix dactylifera TaxID=42345 RepID=A0A8B9A947_PHODC|nr:acid phosphatase 1 [Phoenix dactylifera]